MLVNGMDVVLLEIPGFKENNPGSCHHTCSCNIAEFDITSCVQHCHETSET